EHGLEESVGVEHSAGSHCYYSHVPFACYGADALCALPGPDLCSGGLRLVSILDEDGNLFFHGWLNSRRVNNLRTEVRQLRSFLVAYLVDCGGARYQARICCHNAGNVGPDLDLRGAE